MSESPNDLTGPLDDEGGAPTDPPADPPKAPKATKRRARKTTAAAPKRESSSLYLPALPEGFAYTHITVTGPDNAKIEARVVKGEEGEEVDLTVTGGGIEKDATYPTMAEAVKRGSKAIRGIAKIAEREAELLAARKQAIDL